MTKTWGEWLDNFTSNIEEGYKENRMDQILSGHCYEVDKPQNRTMKYSGPMIVQMVREGEPLRVTTTVSSREVTPYNVGYIVDLREWAQDPDRRVGMDTYMRDIGSSVAEREYYVIVKGLCDYSAHSINSERSGELSKKDIQEALKYPGSEDIFVDTLIINRNFIDDFRKREELWEAWNVPTGYLPESQRGKFFSGMINGLRTYSKRFLEDKVVIFRKNDVMTYTTLIKVSFDREPPTQIIVEKWCSSAPIVDQSVVTIHIKEK